jgi:hypothetical protein
MGMYHLTPLTRQQKRPVPVNSASREAGMSHVILNVWCHAKELKGQQEMLAALLV